MVKALFAPILGVFRLLGSLFIGFLTLGAIGFVGALIFSWMVSLDKPDAAGPQTIVVVDGKDQLDEGEFERYESKKNDVDVLYYIPTTPDGGLRARAQNLATFATYNSWEMTACKTPECLEDLEGQIQQVHGHYLAFTYSWGPSRFENSVPVGYSDLPSASALVLYNAWFGANPAEPNSGRGTYEQAVADYMVADWVDSTKAIQPTGYEGQPVFPIAYKVENYQPGQVTTTVAVTQNLKTKDDVLTISQQLSYIDGDWRISSEDFTMQKIPMDNVNRGEGWFNFYTQGERYLS